MELTHWTVEDSRARRCKRWSVYGNDVIDLTVAEMDLPIAAPILAAVRDAVDRQAFGYPLPDRDSELPGVAATWLSATGLTVPADNIRLTSDVIKAMILGIRHFTEPASPVAMITPTYSRFADAVEAAERRAVHVPMRRTDQGYRLDLDATEDAFRRGARSLLLCNPSNPVGRVYSRPELTELAALVDRFGARVISDEIHAPVRYQKEFTPYATVSPAAAAHSITLTSASKAWNIPGLRCALVVFTADADAARWETVPRAAKGGISPLGMEATIAAFSAGRPWLDQALDLLDANRRTIVEYLDAAGLGHVMHGPEATYLGWLDLREFDLSDPRRHLLERAGVATTAGEEHGTGGEGFVRINFASPLPVVLDALERITGALLGTPVSRSA